MRDLRKGVYILPNLFTSASLFMGFFAIIRAIQITLGGGQNYRSCALAIIAAAFFDMMDGRVARKTSTATKFGVEYDSLSDLISFGAAPAITMYLWTLRSLGRMGWLAAFLYLACGALRLARFNIQVSTLEKKFFQGLPIPMAAMLLAGAVLIWQGRPIEGVELFFPGDVPLYLFAFTFLLALLMVSSIPYRSFKTLSLTTRHSFYYLVFGLVGLVVFVSKPWWFLFALGCVYILSGPVEQYLLPRPARVIAKAKKQRRMKKVLNRIDQLASDVPPTLESRDTEAEQNVHPLRRL